tara:strand:+ start:905 stop:1255 length:351 start_codon:yes stop_codon:yes gene_type:complete
MKTTKTHRATINAHREKWQITLAELSKKSGLSKSWICRYLGGQHDNPTLKTMERLEAAANTLAKQKRSKFHKRYSEEFGIPVGDVGSEGSSDSGGYVGHTHDGPDGTVPAEGATEA